MVTSIYLVMPVGSLSVRHALVGAVTATVLWEITRHVLVWYFGTLSQVAVVYGSLTTAIVVLLSLEIAAALLLFGAQVIAEYERIGKEAGNSRRARFGRDRNGVVRRRWLRSEQLVERQQRKHVDLSALPEGDRRLLVEVDRHSVFQRAPDEMALPESVGLAQQQDVAVGRLRDIRESPRDLARELGAVDDQPDFRVEIQGPLVEVHRADEHALPIEHEDFRMHRKTPRTRRFQLVAASDRLPRHRPHFVQVDAHSRAAAPGTPDTRSARWTCRSRRANW